MTVPALAAYGKVATAPFWRHEYFTKSAEIDMSGPLNESVFPTARTFKIGDVEIRPATNTVVVNAEERYLRQQTMQVLTYLLQRPGELVSKDALIKAIWNDTAVTDDALVQCVVEIRKALGDDPRRPKYVRTVPKGGYCFIGPIAEVSQRVEPQANVDHEPPVLATPPSRTVPRWVTAAVLSAMAAGTALIVGWPRLVSTAPVTWPNAEPGLTRVIVVPFTNQSDKADLDWLRQGLPEMLVTDLMRSPGISVLPPSQLARLQDLDRVSSDAGAARELAGLANADAIITGSFAAVGEALRVDARVHAADGRSLGSESLTAARREVVLSEIDRLAEGLSRLLGRPLTAQQSASRLSDVMTDNLQAFREYVLGVEKGTSLQADAALAHFEAAAKMDPGFAMAQARIGYTYSVTLGLPARGEPYLATAFQQAGRLREKDRLSILAWYSLAKLDFEGAIVPMRQLVARYPDDLEFYRLLSRTLRGEERWTEAQAVIESGLRVNPANKDLYNELYGLYASTWRLDEAIAAAQRYVELSPAEPNAHDSLGLAYHQAGRYEEALRSYEKSVALDPRFDVAIIHIANTYAEQGRYREALAMFQRHIDLMRLPELKLRGQAAQAWVYFYKGDIKRAWQIMQQGTLVESPRYDLAVIALASGDRARFDEELRKPLRVSNRGTRHTRLIERYAAGVQAKANNRPDEAIAAFREASARAPIPWSFPTWDDGLAQALFDYERWSEAEAEYRRLLSNNPSAALYYFRLGQIAERTSRPGDAVKAYTQMIAAWPKADDDIRELQYARAFVAKTRGATTR